MQKNNKSSPEVPNPEIQLNHLFPRKRNGIIMGHWETGKKYLLKKEREQETFIIDELGTFVWNLCTGENSVRKIEKILIKEADQSKETVRTSISTFLMRLKDRGYIIFEQK